MWVNGRWVPDNSSPQEVLKAARKTQEEFKKTKKSNPGARSRAKRRLTEKEERKNRLEAVFGKEGNTEKEDIRDDLPLGRRKQKEATAGKSAIDQWRKNRLDRLVEKGGKGNTETSRPKKSYLFDIIPRWLLYSGLPEKLNQQFGLHAWAIFSCLVSLDCRFNPGFPDWFDQGYEELASLTGLSRWTISRYIGKFEKAKLIRLIKGKFKGSKSRFKIKNFMAVPINPHSIKYVNGGLQGKKGKRPYFRYYESVAR